MLARLRSIPRRTEAPSPLQVSARCQVATCLCVLKAAVARIVFCSAEREESGDGGGGRGGWRDREGVQALI